MKLKFEGTHHEIYISLLGDPVESPVIWILEATLKICGLLYQTLGGIGDTHFQNRWADRGTGSAQEDRLAPPSPQNTASLDISVEVRKLQIFRVSFFMFSKKKELNILASFKRI